MSKNIIGNRYGKLITVEDDDMAEKDKNSKMYTYKWVYIDTKEISKGNLISGTIPCEYLNKKYGDIIGQKFSNLTVVEDTGKRYRGNKIYLCKCDCGNTKEVNRSNLISGHVRSCGCLKRTKKK